MPTTKDSPWSNISVWPKLDLAAISIILWNLFPVFGVFVLGWTPLSVFTFYALETIVVGGFNVLKLLVVYKFGRPPKEGETGVQGLALIPFFIFHYFFFVLVQLTLFFSATDAFLNPLKLFEQIGKSLGDVSYNAALGAFVTNCVIEFMSVFLGDNRYKERTMQEQMFEPYPRIFVQQFVVILGGVFLSFSAGAYVVMFIFVAIKIYADLILKDVDLAALRAK